MIYFQNSSSFAGGTTVLSALKKEYLVNSQDIVNYDEQFQSILNFANNIYDEFGGDSSDWVTTSIMAGSDAGFKNKINQIIAGIDGATTTSTLLTTTSTLLTHLNTHIETFKTDMRKTVVAGTDPLGNNKYQITFANNPDFFSKSEIGLTLNGTQVAQTKRLADGTIQTTFTKDYMNQIVTAYNTGISDADQKIQASSNQHGTQLIQTQQPLRDFLNALNGQSSKGAEMNIGYKFRNYNGSSFIAPQIDLSYFNSKPSRTFYANSTSTSFSTTQDTTHTNKSTKDYFDASYAAGLTTRVGLHLGSIKIPFSVYGLFGGVGTQRQYENAKFKSFGLKYGAGGEIFLSRNLAVFGEFYQIDFLSTNVSNTHEVTTYKIAVTEQFKLESNLKAIKVGLTYYFW